MHRTTTTSKGPEPLTLLHVLTPDPETNFGTPRSLIFPSTREEIRTGNLSTLPVSTPVMSGSSLKSQCMTDFQARKSALVCSAHSLRKDLDSACFLSSSHFKLYSHYTIR